MRTTFFRFVTNHAFDRQTDGQTDTFLVTSPRWHSMQCGKNECYDGKTVYKGDKSVRL